MYKVAITKGTKNYLENFQCLHSAIHHIHNPLCEIPKQ